MRPSGRSKVVQINIDEPLRPFEVEARYRQVLLVVTAGGRSVGEVSLPAERIIAANVQRRAIAAILGPAIFRQRVRTAFLRRARGSDFPQPAAPSVSVVVLTRNGSSSHLAACLESVIALRTSPDGILVVDSSPDTAVPRRLARRYRARYVPGNLFGASRARNRGVLESRGELVAFVDENCTLDRAWIDDLGDVFADPLVMAVTSYVAPLALETRPQELFHRHRGFEQRREREILDVFAASAVAPPPLGLSGNAIFRRQVFEEIGLFAEDLGPGTPTRGGEEIEFFGRILAAGYRIVFDPGRITWDRPPKREGSLRRALFDRAAGVSAYCALNLVRHRDLSALSLWTWWFRHLFRDLASARRPDGRAAWLRFAATEAAGALVGPATALPSHRKQRGDVTPTFTSDVSSDWKRIEVSAEAPSLSVTIASRNRRAELHRVIESLARQTYPVERFEVVVVLDGSTDGSADFVRDLDVPFRLQLFEQEHRGLAASRNQGAAIAAEPIVVFLDDDIVPEPYFLAEHARAHQAARHEHAALGYFPPVLREQTFRALALRIRWEDHFRRKGQPNHQWTCVDFVDGNLSLPRSLFFTSGRFDEDFRGGRRQDWELGVRLLQRGVRFAFYARAKGSHHLDTSLAAGLENRRQEGRYDVLLASKHPTVTSQLPLAALVRHEDPVLKLRARFAFRYPEAADHLAASTVPLLDLFEAYGLYRRWSRLMGMLLKHAYLRGLTDALPSDEHRAEFLAPLAAGAAAETVIVDLAADQPVSFSPAGGSLEICVVSAGRTLARVPAVRPEGQWDWLELTERVVSDVSKNLGSETLQHLVETTPFSPATGRLD